MYGCVKYLFILLVFVGISYTTSAQDSPIEVTAAYPVASQKYQSITLSGAVSSANDAFLAPLQAGLVDKLFVEVGDHVQQGQPLLTLDSKLAELASPVSAILDVPSPMHGVPVRVGRILRRRSSNCPKRNSCGYGCLSSAAVHLRGLFLPSPWNRSLVDGLNGIIIYAVAS